VVVTVPLTAVEERTTLDQGGRLVWARAPSNGNVTFAGERYRARETRDGPLRLAVLTPLAPIEAAIAERQERIRWAVLATFVAFVLTATLAAQLSRRCPSAPAGDRRAAGAARPAPQGSGDARRQRARRGPRSRRAAAGDPRQRRCRHRRLGHAARRGGPGARALGCDGGRPAAARLRAVGRLGTGGAADTGASGPRRLRRRVDPARGVAGRARFGRPPERTPM
jgi:hypothetical protein